MNTCKEIAIDAVISPDLALRHNAEVFFDQLDSFAEDRILINFRNVKTMSRSFAQEYVTKMSHSQKMISEINVPANISKMFQVVRIESRKTTLVDLSKKPIFLTI